MNPETQKTKRALCYRLWNPNEEDFISFKVFQMVSLPLLMVLGVIVSIFLKSPIWTFLLIFCLSVVAVLGLVPSIRFKIINPTKDKKCSKNKSRKKYIMKQITSKEIIEAFLRKEKELFDEKTENEKKE